MTRRIIKQFQDLFLKWNESINLSAARTREELQEHIDDSRAVLPHLDPAKRILDVGSGGGFPVVIAAISRPDISFTALEPVHKKHAFLRTVARELKLQNLESFAVRVEDHESRDYDLAMSRATFDLVEWLQKAQLFIRPGGRAIGFEGIERLDLPQQSQRHSYEMGGKQRAIVIVERAP